jgi:hypothetical protein
MSGGNKEKIIAIEGSRTADFSAPLHFVVIISLLDVIRYM